MPPSSQRRGSDFDRIAGSLGSMGSASCAPEQRGLSLLRSTKTWWSDHAAGTRDPGPGRLRGGSGFAGPIIELPGLSVNPRNSLSRRCWEEGRRRANNEQGRKEPGCHQKVRKIRSRNSKPSGGQIRRPSAGVAAGCPSRKGTDAQPQLRVGGRRYAGRCGFPSPPIHQPLAGSEARH